MLALGTKLFFAIVLRDYTSKDYGMTDYPAFPVTDLITSDRE